MDYQARARRTDVRYLGNLATVFSPTFIRRFCDLHPLREALSISGLLQTVAELPSIADVFEFSYSLLRGYYRCEYLYKNAIAAKIMVGRHSTKTAALLAEVTVSESKADLVLVNGTTVAYEIKTELDSLDRLPAQLQAYTRAFDKTYVVVHESCVGRFAKSIPDGVGLLVLTNRYTLSEAREAASHRLQVDHGTVFDMLRRSEYVPIVRQHCGSVPDVPNTLIYRACRDLFLGLSRDVVHDELIQVLKARGRRLSSLEIEGSVPHSLTLRALTGELGLQQRQILLGSAKELLA